MRFKGGCMRSPSFRALVWAGILSTSGLLVPEQLLGQSAEGIQVHGHWVIEVRNTDGTLHQRRAFENALTEFGKQGLVDLLGKKLGPVSEWLIWLDASTPTNPCGPSVGSTCAIGEPGRGATFDNLTVSTAAGGKSFSLQGHVVAGGDTDVASVRTVLQIPNNSVLFTAAALSPAISAKASQTISVTVTFSFE
jgi:hypothetical protein